MLKDSRGLGVQIVARKDKIIVTGISEHGAAYRFDIFLSKYIDFCKLKRLECVVNFVIFKRFQ